MVRGVRLPGRRYISHICFHISRPRQILSDAAVNPFRMSSRLRCAERLNSVIRESVGSLGWGNGLLFALARALAAATGGRCRLFKYYFVVQPVPAHPLAALPKVSRTRVYQASPADDIIRRFPRPAEVIARRFTDGAACFVAENAGRIVGASGSGWIDGDEVVATCWIPSKLGSSRLRRT
jgi:hypothetical protein